MTAAEPAKNPTNEKEDSANSSSKGKRWKAQKSGPQTRHQTGGSVFKGAIAELNGHVYEVHNEASKANQFQRTTKAIAAYVTRTMKQGKDIRHLIDHLADVDFNALKPVAGASSDAVDKLILQQEVNSFVKRRDLYATNKDALYSIIWGQCSEALQAKLEGTSNFQNYEPIRCPIGLLKDIKQVSLKFENVTFKALAIDDAKLALYSFYQTKNDSLHQYYLKFKDLCDALEHYGADIGNDVSLVRDVAERSGAVIPADADDSDPIFQQYKAAAREQYLAIRFLRGADRAKYGDIVLDLENTYAKGTNHIPSTLAAAYSLLSRIKRPQRQQTNRNTSGSNGARNADNQKEKDSSNDQEIHGIMFVNKDGKQVGKGVACFDCGGDHYKGDPSCPKSKLNQDDE